MSIPATPRFVGRRITTNGNQLVAASTEPLIADAGVFYPITPSTEQGENFQLAFAKGQLNAFGQSFIAIETEGEHAAQGGAIAASVTGKRVVNFTSGQGIVYGLEQYYHAPGKLSTMVLQVGARALTKHALNVHCGHDDIYAALDTGWIMLFAKDAQQASDQSIILRRVTELALNPGMNIQDGFLTTHLERTFRAPEPALIREFLGRPEDSIECPTQAQRELFGPTRRRVPEIIDLTHPQVVGPVQNQEHYMNGVAARRNNFSEAILPMIEASYRDFAALTGRHYGLVSRYRCEDADTIFVALGSAAENIEAAVDHLRSTRGAKVGVVHPNVLRPLPAKALVAALGHAKRLIILERSDEPLAGDNPLTRDLRGCLAKAGLAIDLFSGVYGLGSRDFRPEGIIGAWEFAAADRPRQDGRRAADGERFFYVGIDHPYAVGADETPSLLPEHAIAVRFHSIGGWGMITTGKNLGEILGTLSNAVAERDGLYEDNGEPKEIVHISANPKYGSEKKGAPTSYFLVAAPERIRVNCDLHHVDVVLCCDPKIFLHTDPLEGLSQGGAFVWESAEEDPAAAWQHIPRPQREAIIARNIRIFILDGFGIARGATTRADLQTRMQGNAFLGAFFAVSSFLDDYRITPDDYRATVLAQYRKKFGRLGEAVVGSNMEVMEAGFTLVREVPPGPVDAPDRSSFSAPPICPIDDGTATAAAICGVRLSSKSYFNREYRAGLGYHQPASPLASVGVMAAATGHDNSKYVSRRQVPVWIAENCTQCMDCITICPDTALPNTAQDITTVLRATVRNYVAGVGARQAIEARLIPLAHAIREAMQQAIATRASVPFARLVEAELRRAAAEEPAIDAAAIDAVTAILERSPWAYEKTKAIFELPEKSEPGSGGLFGIFVSDLCKGCAACVEACGSHQALAMVEESEDMHADILASSRFLDLLPDTPRKYLGKLDADNLAEARAATLRFHLMLQSRYNSLVSGDGACAGCGEKSVLRAVATVTEALMRPIFHHKADRLRAKADQIAAQGRQRLAHLRQTDPEAHASFRRTLLHAVVGLGGTNPADTEARIAAEWQGGDDDLIAALVAVLHTDAARHDQVQTIEGRAPNGMCAMAMTAHTGCNSVFGSTPPNNPHPYPWMNSLFQDGATIGWLVAESFIQNHARASVIPERLADHLLTDFADGWNDDLYFRYTHFSDTWMSDAEIGELPKVWVVGGDGGMGDIGFQNVSKVVLQNRPNVNLVMLNTQVYSNTGGQNSDSSVMPGGFDMNQIGPASEGKLTEMKSVVECFMAGHGSPYLAQVSVANIANLFKSIIDGLCYRGSAFLQVYTTCQPEHGVGDDTSQRQATLARDSRCVPEFVFDPSRGESSQEALSLSGNSNQKGDWMEKRLPGGKDKYAFTTAHWAFTEARFRNHHKVIPAEQSAGMIELLDLLQRITMDDVIHRRVFDPHHRSFIPDRGVYAVDYRDDGTPVHRLLSRQLVIFCVERRRNWRMLQSRAGIENQDYLAQRAFLAAEAAVEAPAIPAGGR